MKHAFDRAGEACAPRRSPGRRSYQGEVDRDRRCAPALDRGSRRDLAVDSISEVSLAEALAMTALQRVPTASAASLD